MPGPEEQRYEVVVAAEVGPLLLGALPGFTTVACSEGRSRLVGPLRDPAEVSGVVQALSDLRIDLVSLRRLDPEG